MSLCVAVNNGLISVDAACDYLLLSKEELEKLISSQHSLMDFLAFDTALYDFLLTHMLLSFLSGHITGRIIKLFGKH